MATLVITVEDELLRRAELRAAGRGASIESILIEALHRFTAAEAGAGSAAEFLAFARSNHGSSKRAGREWTRESLHFNRFEQ